TAGRFETTWSSVKVAIVLLPAVHPNCGPHAVLVGIEGYARRPRYLQYGQILRAVQRRYAARFDGSEGLLEADGIRHEFVQYVPHRQEGRVLGQGCVTAGDDLLDSECHLLRLRPALLVPHVRCPGPDLAQAAG